MELLGRVLRDPVDVDWRDRVVLVDGEVPRLAEQLARRREHDGRLRVVATQTFEQRDMTAGVDVEVEERFGHGVDVADLAGEVEHDLRAGRGSERLGCAEIAVDHRDAELGGVVGLEVAGVGAVTRVGRVDDRDLGAGPGQRQRKVGADEPEPAGDDDPTSREEPGGRRSKPPAYVRGPYTTLAAARTSSPTTSQHESPSSVGADSEACARVTGVERGPVLHLGRADACSREAVDPGDLVLDRGPRDRVVHVAEDIEVAAAQGPGPT